MSEGQSTEQLDTGVALVTGGAGDLGRAIGAALAASGLRVILADIDGDAARTAAEDLSSHGFQVAHLAVDVADEESVDAGFHKVSGEYGRLDVLVNNAGIAARRPSIELPVADWSRVLAVNLTGTFLCSRAAARLMLKGDGGAIVNIASIMGMIGNPLYANPAYHASKGGIISLTRAQAVEWAACGIRVNVIAPTFVETRLTDRLLQEPGMRESILARTPAGRLAGTDDVVAAVLFLASDAAALITGVLLPVDGGWTAA